MSTVYLASRSPRRRELLAQIGIEPALVDGTVDERVLDGEPPADYVVRLASAKAARGAETAPAGSIVLGSDTTVVLDGHSLGKPGDAGEAADYLRRLSGRTHEVLTAVAIAGPLEACSLSVSRVTFATLDADTIAAYCATGEPYDKAGGYGIQGRAAIFVTRLEGSYSGVMGLPLAETATLLARAGVPVFS